MSSTTSAAAASSPASSAAPTQATVDEKIMTDLEMVENKIAQCRNLRQGSDMEMLLVTIGFLEACAPRMVELVEAAAQGALSEHVLVKCLDVNDQLTNLLNDIDQNPPDESVAGVAAAATATTTSDPFRAEETLLEVGTPKDDSVPPAIGKTKSEDEFDDFFSERLDTK